MLLVAVGCISAGSFVVFRAAASSLCLSSEPTEQKLRSILGLRSVEAVMCAAMTVKLKCMAHLCQQIKLRIPCLEGAASWSVT